MNGSGHPKFGKIKMTPVVHFTQPDNSRFKLSENNPNIWLHACYVVNKIPVFCSQAKLSVMDDKPNNLQLVLECMRCGMKETWDEEGRSVEYDADQG